MRQMKTKSWEKVLAVLLALALWQGAAMALDSRILLASPIQTGLRLCRLLGEPAFFSAVGFSFCRIVIGFLLALLVGTVLAALAARFHWAEVLLFPYMSVIKATPVASFIILCLLCMKVSHLSVFISFLMVLPVIYTNLLQGIRSTDEKLLEMAEVFRLPPLCRLGSLYLPQIKPYLFSACSISLGMCWKAGIAAEVIGIPAGSVGERLYEAKLYLASADLFAWTIVIIFVSIVFEKGFLRLLQVFYTLWESR